MAKHPNAPRYQNPVAFKENSRPVFRVRKHEDEPTSKLLTYWYSFFSDNLNPLDVRTLPGFVEPHYDSSGGVLVAHERWTRALATEAERVIRSAMQAGCFALPPCDEPVWTCSYCQFQQASEPLPEDDEQWGRCPDCGGN